MQRAMIGALRSRIPASLIGHDSYANCFVRRNHDSKNLEPTVGPNEGASVWPATSRSTSASS